MSLDYKGIRSILSRVQGEEETDQRINENDLEEEHEGRFDEFEDSELPDSFPDSSQNKWIGLDEFYDTISNSRRRAVIRYIDNKSYEEAPFSTGELAETIAAYENGKKPDMLDSKERKRVYVGLRQHHLPVMDERGVIVFDSGRGMIDLPEDRLILEGLTELVRDQIYPDNERADKEYIQGLKSKENLMDKIANYFP